MRKFTEQLYRDMQLKIQGIKTSGVSGFDLYNSCYQAVHETCRQLKEFILEYQFKTTEEEIIFFKKVKPKFHSQLLYFIELIQVEIHKPPAAEKKELVKYYRRVSCYYSSVASRNQIFLHYIRTKQESGDHLLFTRSADNNAILQMDFLELDDKFSTPASNELARINSHEMVVKCLNQKLDALRSTQNGTQSSPGKSLLWTDSKVSLIELAYAIQSCGAVNQGKASVADIIEAFQYIFNIKLGKYYRVFQNIRIRQGSRTAFIDELKEKLTKRMDDTDLDG